MISKAKTMSRTQIMSKVARDQEWQSLRCLQCSDIFVTNDASRMWCSKCQGKPNHFEQLTSSEVEIIDLMGESYND